MSYLLRKNRLFTLFSNIKLWLWLQNACEVLFTNGCINFVPCLQVLEPLFSPLMLHEFVLEVVVEAKSVLQGVEREQEE